MSSLTIDSVSKSFGTTQVLDSVSLSVESGDFFFILGASGCGKTTLLRIIAGLETPTSGRIVHDGRDITETPPHSRGIGLVFQQYALWPHMTVQQNVSFGLEVQRVSKGERDARVREALSLVRMTDFARRYPHEISGGQQQRVALARALAPRPSLLLLDEPLSNLDAKLRDEIREELRALHGALGITMVYVTHDQEDALVLASRIALLRAGSVEQVGAPREIYEAPATRYAAEFLGRANIIPTAHMSGVEAGGGFKSTYLCVRPERVSVSATPPSSDRVSILGVVKQVRYKGGSLEVEVLGPGAQILLARIVDREVSQDIRPDATVYLHWNARDARELR
jgi:putative spermidine/putrescine transport system ATP-binding protein